ncbi:hypothetical protein [Methylocystis echinoides]|jgi:hypothetical protein|uniref:Uncharacterized protein n=1 Tax=Methylocystis echinoides TaxID=29468 RepID=A0A9W6GZE5_9HYPH|nr:hypothetical protein [Methylocystis echinoides]GLI95719.1 hypothetical protein LMG27198_47110 [Methylocystis echinoides]
MLLNMMLENAMLKSVVIAIALVAASGAWADSATEGMRPNIERRKEQEPQQRQLTKLIASEARK